jgi:cation diffusion facilitator family transporter
MPGRGHSHSNEHDAKCLPHVPQSFGTAFVVGTALNAGYVVVELIFGIFAHSLALIADAGHNFGDVLALLLAWGATYLASTPSTARRTYGLGRSSILAALANSALLLIAVGGISWEAIRRFSDPGEVGGKTVMIVAAIGIVINGVTALLFFAGRERDLNIRGAFLHMTADAAVSAGVVIAGLLILLTGIRWIDPGGEPDYQCGDCLGNMGFAPRLTCDGSRPGAGECRPKCSSQVSGRARWRHRRARSAYLAAEHDANSVNGSSGNA